MGHVKNGDVGLTSLDGSESHEEEASLMPQRRRVSLKTAVKLRTATIVVSIVSVVALVILGTVTFVCGAIIDKSSSSFAFALDALLDSLSSIVVIWRFCGNGGNLYSPKRESLACVILGVFFILSSVVILVKSVYGLSIGLVPNSSAFLWYGSITNVCVCSTLVGFKLYLAWKLESRSLLTDAFNTIAGAILALSTIIGEVAYKSNNDIWQIDGITGVLCSVALFGYGVWIIYESCHNLKAEQQKTSQLAEE